MTTQVTGSPILYKVPTVHLPSVLSSLVVMSLSVSPVSIISLTPWIPLTGSSSVIFPWVSTDWR